MHVLIIGGGIGGLTAALACARFGHTVTVLEQAGELGEVGAGIQLPPNAMRVFAALGMADRIARDAVRPDALEARMGPSGRRIFSVPLTDRSQARWGAPYLHIHRADYIAALRDSLGPEVTLRLGAKAIAVHQDDGQVTVQLSGGKTLSGDVLIGADGIHSIVRAALFGPDTLRFTGNIAWRAVVPIDVLGDQAPARTACVWMGAGRHAVTYRLRGEALVNFVGVVERDSPLEEGWSAHGRKADARADFAGWHPTITRLIDAVPDGAMFRWGLYDRAPLERWSEARATLLGDAAHPMLPFMAQGAAMAVEDAWVVAREISRDVPVAEALSRYETLRRPRTSRVQAASRANMTTFHRRSLVSQLATYGPMWLTGSIAPGLIRKRLDWLYGYNVIDDGSAKLF